MIPFFAAYFYEKFPAVLHRGDEGEFSVSRPHGHCHPYIVYSVSILPKVCKNCKVFSRFSIKHWLNQNENHPEEYLGMI